MHILFTGASSFSGSWFVRKLCDAGHHVTATFSRANFADYQGLSSARVRMISKDIEPLFGCSFGAPKMLDYLQENSVDLICMHGAKVGNHRDVDFSLTDAVATNTSNLSKVLDAASSNLKGIVYTGTYFEADVGEGSHPLRAFSPYALSKTFTWQVLRFYCEQRGLLAAKFVMPNPFGPLEKSGFTSYLAKCWTTDQMPVVRTPNYVRDNIPADLLSICYRDFCQEFSVNGVTSSYFEPSGYRLSQRSFAKRYACEIGKRWGRELSFDVSVQSDFSEPGERMNREPIIECDVGWDESIFWDSLAAWYKSSEFLTSF
ncbi:MAG: UDP-glucose 4-epimerase [Oleiphilaceae bacterium]|jgi:hypothetical protein